MPTKKKIHKIKSEADTDFSILGIASQADFYKIIWTINNSLNKSLKINDTLTFNSKVFEISQGENISIISNKSDSGTLLSKFKNLDYLVLFNTLELEEKLKSELRKSKRITAVLNIDTEKLSKKEKTVFSNII